MPVNTTHPDYEKASKLWWCPCRDAYDGSDAVKEKGAEYLPMLPSHQKNADKYDDYKLRAMYYNATGRTVDALAGAVFQKPPEADLPPELEEDAKNITLTGTSLETLAFFVTQEVLKVGRHGILVDMPMKAPAAGAPPVSGVTTAETPLRPYWVTYRAEDVLNWRTERREGTETLTMVVLRADRVTPDPKDRYKLDKIEGCRVLELTTQGCVSSMWEKQESSGKEEETWLEVSRTILTRREEPLQFIPFVFTGARTTSVEPEKPPVKDLVDVNLSHYRTMADLEHGRHYTALPTPWVSGIKDVDRVLSLGSSKAWVLGENGQAGILEFTGQGLASLVTAEQDKRKMMATLGARLLDDSAAPAETATAVRMRHSGEQATLKAVAQTVEQAITTAAGWHAWWEGTEAEPSDVKVKVEFNKEFFGIKMDATEAQVLLTMVQADQISFKTFYAALVRGEWARPGITVEEEQKDIETQVREGAALAEELTPPELQQPPPPGGGNPKGGNPPPPRGA